MTIRESISGINPGANNLGRAERLISAGIVATATVTSGSATLSSVAISSGTAAIGQSITGTGIPANATITAVGAGTLTISANATASGTLVPIRSTSRTGLVGEYLFGRDWETSRINLTGGGALTLNGSPSFGARHALLGAGAWFETGLSETQEMTLLAVFGTVDAAQGAVLVSTFNGSDAANSAGLDRLGGTSGLRAITNNSANVQRVATLTGTRTPGTDYSIAAFRTSGATDFVQRLDQYYGGARFVGRTDTRTGDTRKISSRTLAIGSFRGAAATGAPNALIAGVAIWTRSLADAEMLTESAAISARMAAWPQQSIVC